MNERELLPRRIGLGGALLLAFNGAIGASIFALPAVLASSFGTAAPWLFPIVGLASLLIAIPFSRSVAAFPESGGPATYARVFGKLLGFELGWIYYVARTTAFAANLNVLVAYLSRWWLGAEDGPLRMVLIVAASAGFALVNITGVRRAMRVLGVLTILKTAPLLVAAVAGIVIAGFPAPGPLPPLGETEAGLLLVFYAFVGFENAVVTAGETRNPSRTLPRALLWTIGTVAILYFVVQLAFVAFFPKGLQSGSEAPLLAFGQRLFGPAGALVLGLAAVFSLAGNLHGNMAATSRVTFAMADRGDLPGWFARVHKGFETPAASILFFAAVSTLLALTGTFEKLAVVSTLARMFVYAVTIAAIVKVAGRPGTLSPSHLLLSITGILICALVSSSAGAPAWLMLGALAAGGLLLYALAVPLAARTRP